MADSDVCPECSSTLGLSKTACICGWKSSAKQKSQQPTIRMAEILEAYAQRVNDDMHRPEVRYQRKNDGVDWARKIMARIAAGEKLPIISERFAMEALGPDKQPEAPLREPGEDLEELEA